MADNNIEKEIIERPKSIGEKRQSKIIKQVSNDYESLLKLRKKLLYKKLELRRKRKDWI